MTNQSNTSRGLTEAHLVAFIDEPSDYGAPDVTRGYIIADDNDMEFVLAVMVCDLVDAKANGERFARAINCHDELLAALKAVVSVADRNTAEFDLARAAISKAEGSTP